MQKVNIVRAVNIYIEDSNENTVDMASRCRKTTKYYLRRR